MCPNLVLSANSVSSYCCVLFRCVQVCTAQTAYHPMYQRKCVSAEDMSWQVSNMCEQGMFCLIEYVSVVSPAAQGGLSTLVITAHVIALDE